MHRLRIAVLLLSLSFVGGCNLLQGGKLFAPEAFGLIVVSPSIYVEGGADEATRTKLLDAMERAEQAIRTAYGSVNSRPIVNACVSEGCYEAFGGRGSVAKVYGNRILLSPRGLNWHFLARFVRTDLLRRALNLSVRRPRPNGRLTPACPWRAIAIMKAPAVLRVELRRSRLAMALVGIASIATATLVAWLPGNVWIRAAVAVAAGVQGIATLRSWGLHVSPRAIAVIEIDSNRRAVLTERGGRRIEGFVRAESYVGALLTTLVIRPEKARFSRAEAILPDMMRTEEFRRLRMLLRFGKLPDDASGS